MWSNGNPITPDDIIATFNIIKKTEVNPSVAALLQDTTLEKSEGKITFSNTKKDINFLNIFLQPILPQEIIDSLTSDALSGNFSPVWGIYSGRFILASVNQDDTVGITKITLEKNSKYFKNDMYIDKIIFKLFTDNTHFLKHKSTINLFNDKDNIVWESVPRLNSVFYSLPQFVSIFLNQETVSNRNIRSFILDSISRDTIIETLWSEKVQTTLNPFFSEKNIDIASSKEMAEMMKSKWYYTKKELLENANFQIQESSQKPTISQEVSPTVPLGKIQEELKVIISPTTKKYNFVSEDNILLKGSVPEWVESVYVNEYKLQGYTPGDSSFFYRLAQSYDTMKLWENSYKIYFEQDGKKVFQEEIVYIYDTDTDSLAKKQSSFFSEKASEPAEEKTSTWTSQKASIESSLSLSEIEKLDTQFYYTAKWEVFRFVLVHNNSEPLLVETAEVIKKELEKKGIMVELKPLSLIDITTGLREDTLYYDGILIGINLWYFWANLYPYFHSSQVKNGYNFSNYKQLGLDILLEELKSNNLPTSKQEELEDKVLNLLGKEPISKVLYSPRIRLLIDKSINNYSLPGFIPDSVHRFDSLVDSYLTQKKNIQLQDKWIGDFLIFIFTSLF